jgi:adenylate cyclase
MHVNEERTLEALEECWHLFTELAARYRGRVFNTGGDSVLAEFESTVEAVRCAIEFQEKVPSSSNGSNEEVNLSFRIGINLGDVVVRGDDLFGDGVNIAARMEKLAKSGGVCVSGSVFEQLKNKVPYAFEDMGWNSVKNIAAPVRIYQVTPSGPTTQSAPPAAKKKKPFRLGLLAISGLLFLVGVSLWRLQAEKPDIASVDRMVLSLPTTPSIAVLPFINLGTSSRLELFSDGIARDIITDLSSFADLMVIASTSTFNYKEKTKSTRQVAEELGIRYVLSGSVQEFGENLRINVQLVDAFSGEQLWAERFDRETSDIFAVQDEITQNVVATLGAMEGPIALADRARTRSKHETNLTAYEYVLLARDARNKWTLEGNNESLELMQKAIELDPKYARSYVELAFTYFQDATRYSSLPREESVKEALSNALTAIELDQTFAEGYWVAGDVYAWLFMQPEKALSSYDRALALNPNHADILASWGGWILPTVLERPEEGIEAVKKAMRLSPYHEDWYNWGLMNAYFMAGQYENAVLAFQSIEHPSTGFLLRLAASYAYLGRLDEAQKVAAQVMAKKPDFSTKQYLEGSYQSYANAAREGLLLSGFPE